MAKKRRQSSLISSANILVNYLYAKGILHSLVVHISLLLYLAILFPGIIHNSIKPITINFTAKEELVELNFESLPDIEKEILTQEDSKSLASSSSSILEQTDISTSEKKEDIEAPSLDDLFVKEKDIIEDLSLKELLTRIETVKPKESKSPNISRVSLVQNNPVAQSQNPGLSNSNQLTNNLTGNDEYAGEIRKRLQQYGAKTGDVQVSLSWDTIDDLDLHVVVQPMNSHINWMSKVGSCGGILDIDMNFHPLQVTDRPIENIFWGPGPAPSGRYTVGVHYYMSWSKLKEVKGMVLVKLGNQTKTFPFVVRYGDPIKVITTFNR